MVVFAEKGCILLHKFKRSTVTPTIYQHCAKFKKSEEYESTVFLKNIFPTIQNFFIFCTMQDFCGTILHKKFEGRSTCKIR